MSEPRTDYTASAPPTAEELAEWEHEMAKLSTARMHDFACFAAGIAIPRLIAEVRRLRAIVADVFDESPDVR